MTSAATVCGHFPLVLESGPGAEARNSIGTVLVSGMIIGTLFTFFVVPVFYSLIAARHQPDPAEADAEPAALPPEPRGPVGWRPGQPSPLPPGGAGIWSSAGPTCAGPSRSWSRPTPRWAWRSPDFFPRVSLTGAFGGIAPQVSELFGEGETWSAGGALLSPIFQGKRLQNQHRAALARWEQAKVRDERTLTNAFAAVATALVAYQKLAGIEDERGSLSRRRRARELALPVGPLRLLRGAAGAAAALPGRERPGADPLIERLATLVQLYRALGGGWRLDDCEWAGRSIASAGSCTD